MATRCLWLGLFLHLLTLCVTALDRPSPVTGAEEQPDGVLFHLGAGVLKVQICTSAIAHIVYSPSGLFPENKNPMIVRTSWEQAPFKFSRGEKEDTVSTDLLQIVINHQDGSLKFTDANSAMLLQESVEWKSRQMTPALVNGEQTYHATQVFMPTSGEAFYGLGQHQSGQWNYSGESVELSQDNTNISVPFFTSSLGYGIFWNNASASRFNNRFARYLYLYSDVADTIDYYFIYGPEMDRLIAGYRTLTGDAPLFGKWAYGFWQCKNRYKTQKDLLDAATKYRNLHIPVDNIVQDWFWWTKMGSHIFTPDYPDATAMVAELHREHFHIMISVWPFFAPGSANFDAFENESWFIYHIPASSPWNTGSGLYDALNPDARSLYWGQIDSSLFQRGFDAWWQDVTEPETLVEETNLMSTAHTGMGSGARFANVYALMTTMGIYQGQRKETDEKRVFILTRSGTAGLQRNAAVAWSGDIFSTWGTLKHQIPAGLNYSISGLPYWTTDIGGFVSGDPDDPAYRELFVRWFEYGTFCPIFRVHGTRTKNQNELWSYGPEAQAILTKYDRLRYRLLPYIYSTAWRITHEGYTPMRPLVMDFRTDVKAQAIGDQFLYGPALLVSPVTDPGEKSRNLYLPQGADWYDFWTGAKQTGGRFITAEAPLDTIPLFVRAGSIIPMGPDLQYSDEEPADPIEIRVYPGADGDFVLYEDEGDSYRYEKGAFSTIALHWDDTAQALTIGNRAGNFQGMLQNRSFQIVWVGQNNGIGFDVVLHPQKTVRYVGRAITVKRP
jgi:alpha-D-xyloside xylohydrolase